MVLGDAMPILKSIRHNVMQQLIYGVCQIRAPDGSWRYFLLWVESQFTFNQVYAAYHNDDE